MKPRMNEQICMRAPKGMVALIDRAAKAVGMSRSKFIRHCAETDARIVLAKPKRKPHAT